MSLYLGHFSAYLKDDPTHILWEKKNVEVVIGGWLLAWAMSSAFVSQSAVSGSTPVLVPDCPIWGLALGNAATNQLPSSQDAQKLQLGLVNEIFRKKASFIYFLDPSTYLATGGASKIPVPEISPYIEIQTIFNSNTDLVLQTNPIITEMGLVGGTTSMYTGVTTNPINMGGNPVSQSNGGILLDYVNPDGFQIPTGTDYIVGVCLDFSH